MEAVRRTTSSEGADLDLDGLDQLILPGDNLWPETSDLDLDAPSFPIFFPSPPIFLSDATTATATTNSYLGQPGVAMASEGAMVDVGDPDQLVSGDNASAAIASSSPVSPEYAEQSAKIISTQNRFLAVEKRVRQALTHFRETERDNNVLVQVWVSVKDDAGEFWLCAAGEPFTVELNSEGLTRFRTVSKVYESSADDACSLLRVGLPERVFRGRLPEWCPDVQYITNYSWPTVMHREFLGRRGALGLPVFDKEDCSCLGVIELITKPKLNFTSELDTMCSALQAVDLMTTHISTIPLTKFNSASYKDVLPEVLQILRAACVIHELPLAQTWATCGQQRKQCRRHSNENCRYCISAIDVACHVNDRRVQFFHEACSQHHLLPWQGVAGKAFTTNQRCFLADIGSSSEQEYPLSHHARMFKLKGAMAIRLRSTRTGTADFVLEFFLPTDCEVENEQKTVMDSLWVTVQNLSKTLRMVTNKEMQDDAMWEMNEINSLGLQKNKKVKKRKPMARRSLVWNSFTEVMVGDTVKAQCNYCGNNFCCESKNGTTSLKTHLKRCKFNPDNRITGPL